MTPPGGKRYCVGFNVERFARGFFKGHNARLGLACRAHGPDWVKRTLLWSPDLIGKPIAAARMNYLINRD